MYSARKPYNKLKLSVKDFFTAPVRHLKELILKESVFEKPYWDGEYPDMHLEIPEPDWPDRSPGGGGGTGGGEKTQPGWCFLYCDPTFDCETDPVEIHSAVFGTYFPPTGTAAIEMGGVFTDSRGQERKEIFQQWNDCQIEAWADPGSIIDIGPGQWTRIGPSIAVWVDSNIEDQVIYGHMIDGVGNECFCHTPVTCIVCDCETADPFVIDEGNTDEEIDPGDSATVTVQGGCPPYDWSISGTGHSINQGADSESLTATVTSDDEECGENLGATCKVTIVDNCGTSVSHTLRNTAGTWEQIAASGLSAGCTPGSVCNCSTGPTATDEVYGVSGNGLYQTKITGTKYSDCDPPNPANCPAGGGSQCASSDTLGTGSSCGATEITRSSLGIEACPTECWGSATLYYWTCGDNCT